MKGRKGGRPVRPSVSHRLRGTELTDWKQPETFMAAVSRATINPLSRLFIVRREREFLICVKIVPRDRIRALDPRRRLHRERRERRPPHPDAPLLPPFAPRENPAYTNPFSGRPPPTSATYAVGESARASGWMRPHLNARTYIGEMFNFMGHFAELYVDRAPGLPGFDEKISTTTT